MCSARLRVMQVVLLAAALFTAPPSFAAVMDEGGASSGAGGGYEATIAGSGYGFGMLGGYGIEMGKPPSLDFALLHPYVTLPLTGPVGGSFYRGVLEYKIEGGLGYVDNLSHRGEAGLSPVGLRYNFTASGGRLVPYVEGTLGMVYLNVPKTLQGTRFNFTESAGVGVRYFVSDRVSVDIQARYRHLSNAGIREPNPGFNTGFLLVGISYY